MMAEARERALLASNEEARQFLRQRDQMQDEITRLRAELAEAREVKALVWRWVEEDGRAYWAADGMGITYEAGVDIDGHASWTNFLEVEWSGTYVAGGADAAKDAAQADYASRILAALVKGE